MEIKCESIRLASGDTIVPFESGQNINSSEKFFTIKHDSSFPEFFTNKEKVTLNVNQRHLYLPVKEGELLIPINSVSFIKKYIE